MTKWFVKLMVWAKDEEGADLAEYGLLLALIAVVAITALTSLGQNIANTLSRVAAAL
jgi:pilus assembly protein Flp/PilA